jgi:hypothetical protein
VALPPSITRVKPLPLATMRASAPIRRSKSSANTAPAAPIASASARPSAIPCVAVRAAEPMSFSPTRRATSAITPIDTPIATA